MVKIYCYGTEAIEEDAAAIRVCRKISLRKIEFGLGNIEFIESNSINDILEYFDDNKKEKQKQGRLVIVDVAKGINEIKVMTEKDIGKLKTRNITSLHDFDLGFFLKMMKEVGMEAKIRIIALPVKFDVNEHNIGLVADKLKELAN